MCGLPFSFQLKKDHFTVGVLVAWPRNGGEACVDLGLVETTSSLIRISSD